MSCFTPVIINGKEVVSKLQPQLLKILKTNPHIVLNEYEDLDSINDLREEHYEEIAGKSYNYFETSEFNDDFGEWQNDDTITKDKYDTGEPKLHMDSNKKYFYRDKYDNKVYFPFEQNGLNFIFQSEEIQEATRVLASVFFKHNFNNDWNDLSFMNNGKIEDTIKPYIFSRINELKKDNEFFADRLQDSLFYMDEWVDNVTTYFENLGFKVNEIDDDNIDEETIKSSTQDYRKTSFEQDPTLNISANIKSFLSFIPTSENIDTVFIKSSFVEFNDIYNTLQSGLSNISPTIRGGNVEDVYQIMLDKIGTLAHKKPYLKELLNILNNPTLTEERRSEFTQAFSLNQNNMYVEEIDFRGDNIKHSVKNVADVNAKHNTIKREWGFNFETELVSDRILDKVQMFKIIDDLKLLRSDFDLTRELFSNNSELETSIVNIVAVMRDLGAETTEKGFNSYLGNLSDVEITGDVLANKINTVLTTLEKFTKNLNTNIPKDKINIYYKDKFINPFNNQSLFTDLAKEEALYQPDGSDASVYASGKSTWVYSLPSHISSEINKWKSNIEELENIYQEPGNKSSKIMEYLLARDQEWNKESDRIIEATKRINNYKSGIFNALQNKKTDNISADPKNNSDLAKDDAIVASINKALLNMKGDTSLFNTPTPADKSTSFLLGHGYFLNTNINEVDNKRAIIPSHVTQIFYDYFVSEYSRMVKARDVIQNNSSTKHAYYHTNKNGDTHKNGKVVGNVFKSQIFESLSFDKIKRSMPDIADKIYNKDGTPAIPSVEVFENELKNYIEGVLKESIAAKINDLIKVGVIQPDASKKGSYKARGIDATIMHNYNVQYDYPVLTAVSDYHINTLINNYEYSKMFSGDPAYYKDMTDYAKRIPATYTDGLPLRLLNNDQLTFNAAIISNVELASVNLDPSLVGEDIVSMYNNINTTDAQAWITPVRWEFIVRNTGLWTKNHETALPKMLGADKSPFTKEELKAVAQPLKGVYFKKNNGVPTFLKYSQAVLLPDLIQGTDLQKLYDKMVSNEIDEVITLDGIKVGAIIPNTIHNEDGSIKDDFELIPLQLDNRGWKLQQNLPVKGIKDTDLASQIQKNVLSGLAYNLDETFQYGDKEVTGEEVYSQINELIGALSEHGQNDFIEELDINPEGKINNTKGLYDLLLKEAKKRDINDNLVKALEKEISIYGIPQSHSKLMNMFMSIVTDRLVKIKTNGGSFIQVSNFGIDKLNKGQKTGVKWFIDPKKGLKPPHFEKDENGEFVLNEKGRKIVKPGQILLPGSLLTKYIPNWKDMDAADLKAMISPEILENIIGYRIPNQGLSSNDALEIVGFLPEGMGDAVVAYSEIPTKTGSDFDIDKMYMMIPSFTQDITGNLVYAKPKLDNEGNELPISEQSKEVLQNKLIEAYKAVFLNENVIKNVMTPIDFDHLERDIKAIRGDVSNKDDLYHFDALNQIDLKYSFLAGKAGTGQLSNQLVDHVRGMFTQNSLRNTNIGWGHVNSINETLFDREFSEELSDSDATYIIKSLNDFHKGDDNFNPITVADVKSYRIADSISAALNANLDIAKDPFITDGNYTTQTNNVIAMMFRAGMHPMYVNRFIGQPIIKEYIDFVVNAESKFNNEKGNVRTLFLESKDTSRIVDSDFQFNNKSLKWFDDQMDNYNNTFQNEIINKFFDLQDNSKKLVQGINAAKVDVDGPGKDLSSRLITQNLIEEIENDDYNKVEGSLTNFSDKLVDPLTNDETILGHYANKSIYWLDSVVKANPKLFLLANEDVENTFNAISNQLRGTKLLNQQIADELYSNYYAYSLSGFDGLRIINPAKELFVDLAKEVSTEKLEDDYNYLLQQLEVVEEDGINFIRLQNKKRSKNIQNKLYRGWKDLMETNKPLAIKLIKYAYYQSGFKNNPNEFFSHIPHEYFVETKLNKFVYEINDNINGIQDEFIDQFYRHNANNTLIVPNVFAEDSKVLVKDISYTFNNINSRELPLFVKFNNNLLKLEGYDKDGKGIYVKTFKLGITKKNGSIIEYNFNNKVSKSQLGPVNNTENLSEINEYLKTLKVHYKASEYDSYNNQVVAVKPLLTKSENEFNDMFEENQFANKNNFIIQTANEFFPGYINSENLINIRIAMTADNILSVNDILSAKKLIIIGKDTEKHAIEAEGLAMKGYKFENKEDKIYSINSMLLNILKGRALQQAGVSKKTSNASTEYQELVDENKSDSSSEVNERIKKDYPSSIILNKESVYENKIDTSFIIKLSKLDVYGTLQKDEFKYENYTDVKKKFGDAAYNYVSNTQSPITNKEGNLLKSNKKNADKFITSYLNDPLADGETIEDYAKKYLKLNETLVDTFQLDLFSQQINDVLDEYDNGCKKQ